MALHTKTKVSEAIWLLFFDGGGGGAGLARAVRESDGDCCSCLMGREGGWFDFNPLDTWLIPCINLLRAW